MPTPAVAPLRTFGRGDLAVAGGKAVNLGELLNAGFPVPDGFVVTTAAYRSAVDAEALRIPERAEADRGEEIRADIEALPVPADLREAVAAAYGAMGSGPVAVRSSATAEDLPGAAFAGQQDTYLNVVGAGDVVDAVRRCWASLWTDRAIAYRREHRVDSADVSIAVVVQTMAAPEFAGVMFTADPVTGDRDKTIVDSSPGLGEAVVSGLVTPDHYVLDRHGKVLDFRPGRAEVVITAAEGGGVVHSSGAGAAHLPEAALRELARVGALAVDHFGRPQDMEWAWSGERLIVLQARPMTAMPPAIRKLGARDRIAGSVLTEFLPVRPYPMDLSTWLPHGPAGLMREMAAYFGISLFSDFLVEDDGVVEEMIPHGPHPNPGIFRGIARFTAHARKYDPADWASAPALEDFYKRIDELEAADLAALDWDELIAVPDAAIALVRPVTLLRTEYLPRAGLSMLRLLLALRRLGLGSLLGDIITGAPTRTAEANRELERLAATARADTRLTEAVESLDARRLGDFPEFRAEFNAFLAEFGHRETVSPLLVSPPTWGEDPATVLGLIKALLEAGSEERQTPAERAERTLFDHPKVRRDKALRTRLEARIGAAREGIAFREDSHFLFMRPLPILRRSLLELGRRLTGAGILETPEDVFHLLLAEVQDLGDPAEATPQARAALAATARDRAERRATLADTPLINPRSVFPAPKASGDAIASGTPAGGGTATGPVRIVREAAEFGRLQSGDILVCPYTNPSWTPLFARAAAVVVDTGAAASHAAIVAREYGLPAVMGTADGTRTLTDGQLVTVDGELGTVTAADTAAAR